MSTFVSVPVASLDALLLTRNFTVETVGAERVYTRAGKLNPLLRIAVYSSATEGATLARGCGEDAIRVVLLGKVSQDREWCLRKTTRIHRTGTVEKVLDRVLDRVKEAANAAKEYGGPCAKCGAPTYEDSGRCIARKCRGDA
jgi:hypothetical protein